MPGLLFRREALQYQRQKHFGSFLVVQPLSHAILSLLLVVLVAGVLVFLTTHSYARKQPVRGLLVSAGAVSVGPSNNGRITSLNVETGQWVEAGQRLFTLRPDEIVTGRHVYGAELLANIEQRKDFVNRQIILEQEILADQQNQNSLKQEEISERMQQLDLLIANSVRLLEIHQEAYTKLQHLAERGLIAAVEPEIKFIELLEQENALENLYLRRAELVQEKNQIQHTYRGLDQDAQRRILVLRADLQMLERESLQAEAGVLNHVLAPLAGRIQVLTANQGDFVNANQRVAVIDPNDEKLVVELFVPSNAIGFIEPGQTINIRLDAYPYQKFGTRRGVVSSVANSLVLPEEVPANLNIQEGVFKVSAELDSQSIEAYGETLRLRSGIQLQANIVLEQRSFLEWLLEPLFSVLKA